MTTKNSEESRHRILSAARRLLAEKGFRDIGINSIAREAGLDKVLIYRYFGGLPELLRELATTSDFWPTVEEIAGTSRDEARGMDAPRLAASLIKGRMRELRKRPATQEILRWELIERNELTDQLHHARERQGDELNALLPLAAEKIGGIDIGAMAAIVMAGVTYLVLRSKTADTFNGVDLHAEEGWRRIEKAVDDAVDILFDRLKNNLIQEGKE